MKCDVFQTTRPYVITVKHRTKSVRKGTTTKKKNMCVSWDHGR